MTASMSDKKEVKTDFMEQFSEEQKKYITSTHNGDTKLIACAGSGKTRTIIGRIKYMVENSIAAKNEIYAITYSKMAAGDFQSKIKALFPDDYRNYFNIRNFSTIDSLAWKILKTFKPKYTEDFTLLSTHLREWLKEANKCDVQQLKNSFKIKHLFVDEAQDLCNVRYSVLMFFREKLGTTIHMVGDPNQTIYQFNDSSSEYLENFDAEEYSLTYNWRSTKQIIDFSNYLKPFDTVQKPGTRTDGSVFTGPLVQILCDTNNNIHQKIVDFIISQAVNTRQNIAILCPTAGRGEGKTVGLSVITSLLEYNKIAYTQLYYESSNKIDRKHRNKVTLGHVNLMTYHGSKGLEFDTVFVMDFYQNLMCGTPTKIQHAIHKYLLYVACSRAKKNMFICTYNETVYMYGYINRWLKDVNEDTYDINIDLEFPEETTGLPKRRPCIGITDIIHNIKQDDLVEISSKLLTISSCEKKLYPSFENIDRLGEESLFGTFCEELFYLQYSLWFRQPVRELAIIEHLINREFLVVKNEFECKILRDIFINEVLWIFYDKLDKTIQKIVSKYFKTRGDDFDVICDKIPVMDKVQKIINNNLNDISVAYTRYQNPHSYNYDYREILEDFFYLVVVMYAYNNNHFFYMNNHGEKKRKVLEAGRDLYKQMNRYVKTHFYGCEITPKIHVRTSCPEMCGEIDFIQKRSSDNDEIIVDVKCTKSIGTTYYLQLFLYNLAYYGERNEDKIYDNVYKIVNFLTGKEYLISIVIDEDRLRQVLEIVEKAKKSE